MQVAPNAPARRCFVTFVYPIINEERAILSCVRRPRMLEKVSLCVREDPDAVELWKRLAPRHDDILSIELIQ